MPLPRASWSFYCHRLSNSIFFFMKPLQSKTNKILLIPNVTRRNTFGRRSQFSFLIPSLTLLISSTCTYDTAPRTLLVMIVTLNETSRATIWARNPGQVIHHGQDTLICWFTGKSPFSFLLSLAFRRLQNK